MPPAAVLSGATPRIVFEGFYVRDLGGDPRRAARAARALTRTGSPWRLVEDAESGRGSSLPGVVIEWHAPRGARVAAPTPSEAWAWSRHLARDLERTAGTRGVTLEPLFELHGATVARTVARAGVARRGKSSGSNADLPCAASNPMWSLEAAHVPAAWALPPASGGASFGEGVRVGHPDTGYQLHPEIWPASPSERRVLPAFGYDFLDGDPDPLDPLVGDAPGHGTATASVIMSDAQTDADRFVVGVAPRAELVPLRVSWSVIHFSFSRVTRAIRHATDVSGAHVISMSLGGPFPSGALEDAIEHAVDRDVIVLAAAGNVWPWVVYPARYPDVVAVAASNCRGVPWKSSASGGAVDVTAPGESVWRAETHSRSGRPKYTVAPSSGTSYAVATTAGACALWLAHHGRSALIARYGQGNLAAAFRRELVSHGVTTPNGWDRSEFGAGILNVHGLLAAGGGPSPKSRARTTSTQPGARAGSAKARVPADRVERALELFPAAERVRVEAFLERRLGRGKSRARALGRVGDELVFQLATNPALRAAASGKAIRSMKSVARAPRAATAALSPELAQLLNPS